MTLVFALLLTLATAHEASVYVGEFASGLPQDEIATRLRERFGSKPHALLSDSLVLGHEASTITPHRVAAVRLRLFEGDFVLLDRAIPLSEFEVRIGREIALRLSQNRTLQVRAALEGRWLERVFIGFENERGLIIASGSLPTGEAASMLGLDWPTRARNWVFGLCAGLL